MLSLRSPGSRALLVGCDSYDSPTLGDIPSARNSLEELAATLRQSCGMAPSSIRLLANPRSTSEIGFAIADLSEQATDVLLFYYVGHGLVSASGDLYLSDSTTDARPNRLPYSALRYNTVRDSFRDSNALNRLIILDSCWSGRAIDNLGSGDAGTEPADLARLDGACVLAAAARDELALAPAGSPYTAFSGELIHYLRHGDPVGPRQLTVAHAFRHLALSLPQRGYPLPQRRVSGGADSLVLADNRAYNDALSTLQVTPRLGMQIWQDGSRAPMFLSDDDTIPVVHVSLDRSPFEIWFPKIGAETAVQVCAWIDDSIFSLAQGEEIGAGPPFGYGTGLADYEYGSGRLYVDDNGHNYLIGTRIQPASDRMDKTYVGAIFFQRRSTPISQWERDIYLTVYIDKKSSRRFDLGSYEYLHLRFLS